MYFLVLDKKNLYTDLIASKNGRFIYTTKSMYLIKVNNNDSEAIYAKELKEGLDAYVSGTHNEPKLGPQNVGYKMGRYSENYYRLWADNSLTTEVEVNKLIWKP